LLKLIYSAFLAVIITFSTTAVIAAPYAVPSAPKIAAKGYLLIDFNSGKVIAEQNSDQRMEPASLTKMMSAYIVSQEIHDGNLTLDTLVTVSEKAWRMPGSRMFIEVGKKISVEELLNGVIIQSGNDSTVALAEHIAGNEETFASLMNQYAAKLGMNNTNFVNSTGLPHEDHYTTPKDMATMAIALIRDFPEEYKIYSVKQFKFNDISQYNRNKLLWRDNSVDGVKTGHTESAGYCLVASAKKETMRLVSVVLGTRSERAREQESQKLLNYGFRFFETQKLYSSNESLATARLWKGISDEIALGINNDLFITVPRGQYKNLKPLINYPANIEAPIAAGTKYGTLQVKLQDKLITEQSLVALADVERGSWWKRLMDSIKLFFSNLFS